MGNSILLVANRQSQGKAKGERPSAKGGGGGGVSDPNAQVIRFLELGVRGAFSNLRCSGALYVDALAIHLPWYRSRPRGDGYSLVSQTRHTLD